MGSFLMKCFVSNQTIRENVDAVYLPILKHVGYNDCKLTKNKTKITVKNEFDSVCYSNSFWELLGVKIDVIADDYGHQNLVDTEFNKSSLNVFFNEVYNRSFKTAKGKNPCHDQAFDFDKTCKAQAPSLYSQFKTKQRLIGIVPIKEYQDLWEVLTHAIGKNRVFLKDYKGDPAQLQGALCLRDAYNYLANKHKDDASSKRLAQSLVSFKDHFKTLNLNQKGATFLIRNLFSFCNSESKSIHYSDYLMDKVAGDEWKKDAPAFLAQLEKEIADILDFASFQTGINDLYIKILPMSYGGQDYQNKDGLEYAKMVMSVAKNIARQVAKEEE